MMQSALRGEVQLLRSRRITEEERNMKKSKVGTAIQSKIKNLARSIKGITVCQICNADIEKPKNKNLEVYMCDCVHKFDFC